MTIPDLVTVEAYHTAVIATISARMAEAYVYERVTLDRDRTLADRALDGLRRHRPVLMYRDFDLEGFPYCAVCDADDNWPCPDALDRWADLTAIGTTYGVKS